MTSLDLTHLNPNSPNMSSFTFSFNTNRKCLFCNTIWDTYWCSSTFLKLQTG